MSSPGLFIANHFRDLSGCFVRDGNPIRIPNVLIGGREVQCNLTVERLDLQAPLLPHNQPSPPRAQQ